MFTYRFLPSSLLQDGDGPRCHFFNSFFLNKLYQDAKVYNYNEVRRWSLPIRLKSAGQLCESILDCDRIIIPMNQGNMHWVCAVIDLQNKKLIYYDSLAVSDPCFYIKSLGIRGFLSGLVYTIDKILMNGCVLITCAATSLTLISGCRAKTINVLTIWHAIWLMNSKTNGRKM